MELNKEQRLEIAREEIAATPDAAIGIIVLMRFGKIVVETEAESTELITVGNYKGQDYLLTMEVTAKKICKKGTRNAQHTAKY